MGVVFSQIKSQGETFQQQKSNQSFPEASPWNVEMSRWNRTYVHGKSQNLQLQRWKIPEKKPEKNPWKSNPISHMCSMRNPWSIQSKIHGLLVGRFSIRNHGSKPPHPETSLSGLWLGERFDIFSEGKKAWSSKKQAFFTWHFCWGYIVVLVRVLWIVRGGFIFCCYFWFSLLITSTEWRALRPL